MAVTLEDAWKHVSNKIANKVNNIWEDLNAMIIPVDADGNFMKPIVCTDKPEYNGDSYDMIRSLCWDTDLLPSPTFLYVCPGRARQLDSDPGDVENIQEIIKNLPYKYILTISLVHPMKYVEDEDTWVPDIDHGVYWVDKNTFERMPTDGKENGQLPLALGALSFKLAIDRGLMGDVSKELGEALELARQSFEKVKKAVEHPNRKTTL